MTLQTIIRIIAAISFIAVGYHFWGNSLLGMVFMLLPYGVVFLLANRVTYETKLKSMCRGLSGVIVCLLSLGLLFGEYNDPQSGIGIAFAVLLQYGVIFATEAVVGLVTFREQ